MSQGLQAGEYQVGRYKVRFARFSSGSWHTRGPWMRISVTNRRLIILPDEVRNPDQTALVIPAEEIRRVWTVCLGKRDGGVIALRNGELLYFFVDWSQSIKLMHDIRQTMKPAATPTQIWHPSTNKPYIN